MQNPLGVHLTYLGGHPDVAQAQAVWLERHGEYLSICPFTGQSMGKAMTRVLNRALDAAMGKALNGAADAGPLARIPLTAIRGVKLERASSRSVGKALAGAVVGGVLLGPLGLVAGTAMGARRKKESVIVLTVQQGPAEVEVLFGGEKAEGHYPRLIQLLQLPGRPD